MNPIGRLLALLAHHISFWLHFFFQQFALRGILLPIEFAEKCIYALLSDENDIELVTKFNCDTMRDLVE